MTDYQQLRNSPQNKVLIVLGDLDPIFIAGLSLESFVFRGGSLLFATDRTYLGPGLRYTGVMPNSGPILTNEQEGYRGLRDCIFVKPIPGPSNPFTGLSRVATNRAGFLSPVPNSPLELLAVFPERTLLSESLRRPVRADGFPFAMGEIRANGGRQLLIADHSVFINAMLWQADNENLDFAYRCVDWLTEEGKRKEVLFLDESRIQDTFDIPLKELPPLPLDSIPIQIQEINNFLRGLEEENRFNYWLLALFDSMPKNKVFQFLLVVGSLGLAMLGLNRLSQARFRLEPGVPMLAAGLSRLVPRASVLEQRRRAMELERNYWEAARGIAREGLSMIFGHQKAISPLSPAVPLALPGLDIQAGWWQKRHLRNLIARLWQLAYAASPVRVSSRELQGLPKRIDQLREAVDAGALRLAPPGQADGIASSPKVV